MAALRICFLVLLGAVAVRSIDQDDYCIKLSQLKVCECEPRDSNNVVCSNIRDVQNLVDSLETLRNNSLFCGQERPNEFTLEKTTSLEALPSGLFDGLAFEFLQLNNVDLNFVAPGPQASSSAFNGLAKSLRRVALHHVRYVQNWEWSKVEPMVRVIVVRITDSTFNYIRSSFSKPFFNVIELEISNSNVILIERGAIPSNYLRVLNLSKNKLRKLTGEAFSATPKNLIKLDLSENRIEYLEENLLRSMPALRILELENNKLFQVTEKLFSPWHRDAGKPFELILYIHGTRTSKEDCKVVSKLASDMYTIEVNSDCEEKARAG